MLSIQGSNGHGWRCILCKAIQAKLGQDEHDYDNETVIRLFAEGEDWARRNKIPIPPDIDHAAAFITSRDRSGELVIPEHMRRFCADVTKTPFSDGQAIAPSTAVRAEPRPPKFRAPVRQSPAQMRM